jgi:type IV pilus assembly protein PilV
MKRSRGFTLIEVLITVFVMGVGLLALAGLQIIAKKASFDAAQRTLAGQATQDILTRMRANAGAVGNYVVADAIALSAPGANCAQAECNPAELAAWDLFQWAEQLAVGGEVDDEGVATGGLAQPTACILAGSTVGHYRIAIAWRGITPLAPPEDANDPTDPANVDCGTDAYLDDQGLEDFRRVMVSDVFIASAVS